jgi:ectoine hydroxylase-related dioxygenase (phytanoyl-CoA dioxygenase family)
MNDSPRTKITTAHKDAYQRDGVVLIKGAFDSEWVELLLSAWNRLQSLSPGELYKLPGEFLKDDPRLKDEIAACRNDDAESARIYTEQSQGFLRYKYMRWWMPEFRKFALESPAAEIVGRVIGSDYIRFFVDAVFAKAPGCQTSTYWHSDQSAWPVRGTHVPTMWMTLLPVDAKLSSLEYIAGSHRFDDIQDGWPNTYNAKTIGKPRDRAGFYDWEARRGDPSIRFVSYDMDPGDVVVLHASTYHGGGANLHPTQPRVAFSTRWFGDDVVWNPRPECLNIPGMPFERMVRGQPASNDEVFPVVWNKSDSGTV